MPVLGQTKEPGSAPPDKTVSNEVAPGVRHTSLIRKNAEGLWSINYLEIDPALNRLEVARAMDEMVGSETSSSIAVRHGAVAAVNGGYFRVGGTYRGEPVGTFVTDGVIKSEPNGVRPSLAVDSTGTRVALAGVSAELWVETGQRQRLEITGVDRPREANEVILYTSDFHRTTLTNPDGIEIIVQAGRVTAIRKGGSSSIPANGFVISASGKMMSSFERFRIGDRLILHQKVSYSPEPGWVPASVLGAGPILLQSGKASDKFEGFPESFLKTRHPRTAMGIRQNGMIVLVTVDGRQAGKSDGMSIYELQKLMAELGCAEAINLDGGGSTTMVIKGKVVNSVSDATGERPVSDAILVISRKTPR